MPLVGIQQILVALINKATKGHFNFSTRKMVMPLPDKRGTLKSHMDKVTFYPGHV
jgi:hypothetical protein